MNPVIKIIFLPIMLVAGVFTVAVISLINAPFMAYHRWRERRFYDSDLRAARERREKNLAEIYGKPPAE